MTNKACVLLVEDDPNDVLLLHYAFKKAGLDTTTLMTATDGQEAVDYLSGQGKYGDRKQFPRPQLILLDLKLPRVPGLEVLKWITARSHFDPVPVLVLSSSDHPRDVEESKRCGAQAFMVKPIDNHERVRLARFIKECWIEDKRPLAVQQGGSPSGWSNHVVFVSTPRNGSGPKRRGAAP